MSLASQVSALAGAVRDKINAIMPRLLPSGGVTGQALTKISGSDYSTQWTSLPRITIAPVAPSSPQAGDVWIEVIL